jgi:hypothetical protein
LSTPHTATSPGAILIDGISAAVANRPGLTPERRQTRVNELWAVIDAFRPADPLQIMLVGQAVMFNELLADGARDALSGITDGLKLRAQSNLNGLNRSLHQNLNLFLRLRDTAEAAANEAARGPAEPRQPRAAVPKAAAFAVPAVAPAQPATTAEGEAATTPGAEAQVVPAVAAAEAATMPPAEARTMPAVAGAEPGAELATTPPAEARTMPTVAGAEPQAEPAAAREAVAEAAATPATTGLPAAGQEPAHASPPKAAAADEGSWLDEPFTTWVIETPAAAGAREAAELAAETAAEASPRTAELHQFDEAMTDPRPGRRQRTAAAPLAEPGSAAMQRVEMPEMAGTS